MSLCQSYSTYPSVHSVSRTFIVSVRPTHYSERLPSEFPTVICTFWEPWRHYLHLDGFGCCTFQPLLHCVKRSYQTLLPLIRQIIRLLEQSRALFRRKSYKQYPILSQ